MLLTILKSSGIIIELTPKGVSKEAKTVQEKIKKFLTTRKSFGRIQKLSLRTGGNEMNLDN